MANASMELRKWRGNSIASNDNAADKALGICWELPSDQLHLPSSSVDLPTQWTRRSPLRTVAALFDPLGLMSPVTITGRILLQCSWKEKQDWDAPLSSELCRRAEKWKEDIAQIDSFSTCRWIGTHPEGVYNLHLFCDASEVAYGCCVYLVMEEETHLLYSKVKVAPLKSTSLARLEMQAAFLGSKSVESVIQQLRIRIAAVNAWTDSINVWYWLQKPSHYWKTWVANRVSFIYETSTSCNITWRHCPGSMNRADLPSRGATIQELRKVDWLHAPKWTTDVNQWPPLCIGPAGDEVSESARPAYVVVNSVLIENTWWTRMSTWTRILGTAAYMLKWKYKEQDMSTLRRMAETLLFKVIQETQFSKEIDLLRRGKPLPYSSKLYRFAPFLHEDGLLRIGGRWRMAEWDFDRRHPILLGKHYLTEVFIRSHHIQRMHQGVDALLTFIRNRFWIIGGRRLVRQVKRRCMSCKRHDSAPCSEVTAPLPVQRIQFERPFKSCGIDYAGPLSVRDGADVCKVWLALFVCAASRAIHLEVVRSLQVDDFLLAFSRFAARRNRPDNIISDNATTFHAAAKELDIEWSFIPPASPWFGGFYERLVRAVKMPMKKVLGRSLLHCKELETVATEVEKLVNSRPLTHVGGDDEPSECPLTPAMLIGDVWGECPYVSTDGKEKSASARFKHLKTLQEHLARRWESEYVTQLRQFNNRKGATVHEGDVVLVVNDKKKRADWKLGLVNKVFKGRDDRVRVAEVKIGSSTFVRSVHNLVPMEIP